MDTQPAKPRFKTLYKGGVLDASVAYAMYIYLQENLNWIESVRGKQGHTRMGAALKRGEDPVVDGIIATVLVALGDSIDPNLRPLGIYANWYQSGQDYCPQHNHEDTIQMVISFGATRKLKVSSKYYNSGNGDVILFGGAMHGIAKEPEVTEGRISLAVFMG